MPQDFYLLIKKCTLHGTNGEVHMDPRCDTCTGGDRCGEKCARHKRGKGMNLGLILLKGFVAEISAEKISGILKF
jgi:hypothetical protein